MPYTNLTLFLSSTNAAVNTTFTFSTTNTSFAFASQVIENIPRNGGIFDDLNDWYPATAIMRVRAN